MKIVKRPLDTSHDSELCSITRYYPRSLHGSSPSVFLSDPGRRRSFSAVPPRSGSSRRVETGGPLFEPLRAGSVPLLNSVSRGRQTVRSASPGILPAPKGCERL